MSALDFQQVKTPDPEWVRHQNSGRDDGEGEKQCWAHI